MSPFSSVAPAAEGTLVARVEAARDEVRWEIDASRPGTFEGDDCHALVARGVLVRWLGVFEESLLCLRDLAFDEDRTVCSPPPRALSRLPPDR